MAIKVDKESADGLRDLHAESVENQPNSHLGNFLSGQTYSSVLRYFPDIYRSYVPSKIRTVIRYTAPGLMGIALTTGIVAYAQYNGADQPKPKIEQTPIVDPWADCTKYNSLEDMMKEECFRQQALRVAK